MVRARLLLLPLVLTFTLGPAPSRAQDAIDAAQLKASIDKGLEWLKKLQQPDGSFQLPPVTTDTLETGFPMGYSALATLTLLKCGVPPDDPSIELAFQHLYALPLRKTYSVALLILCIEARFAPPPELIKEKEDKGYTTVARRFFRGKARKQDLGKLQECVNWLVANQSKKIGAGWRYPPGDPDQDNSCTQYAMLGLKGARRLGAEVPIDVFERVADFFVAQQDATGPAVEWFPVPAADGPIYEMLSLEQRKKQEQKEKKRAEKSGTRERDRTNEGELVERRVMNARGWSYEAREVPEGPPPADRTGPVPDRKVATQHSTGSMTSSGIAALCIAKSELELFPAAWRPRQEAVEQAIRDGCAWLALYFNPQENPSTGPNKTVGWKYYYLYSVERAGVLAGTYKLGPHDWWEEGAAHLLTQQLPEGPWPDAKGLSMLSRTCFALLFLKRATIPLLPLPPKRVMTGGGH